MCGICGIINFNNQVINKDPIHEMMKRMKHRGPDDEGIYLHNNIGFGFVRLSIIDLSYAGHQPMSSPYDRYTIIFNGEIYNYIEIRKDLELKGYIFRTKTDTEVLLNSYIEWGSDCLNKFNGMFAFAIYDKKNGVIFIARDRFGIKPFYYFQDNNSFIFASEIPPIIEILEQKPLPDNQSIFDFLVFNRTDQTDRTFFQDIKKLQHGQCISIKDSHVTLDTWYRLREHIKDPFQNPEEYLETFQSAVGLRLRSDVPVGVCLSGGLDSSSIVSVLLKNFNKYDLNTFSAVYEKGQTGDETEFINEYLSSLNNMYYTTPNADSLYNDLDAFVSAHGEPIPSTSPYAQFKVMELAQKNVVVTLDGQGADEELAGYHYFFGYFFKDLLQNLRLFKLGSEILHYLTIHKSLFGLKTFLYFLLPENLRTRTQISAKAYLTPDFIQQYQNTNSIAGNLYGSKTLKDALLDHFEYKLEHLLKWEDRNSMWFSLESRVPFLDHNLVEKTLALPGDQKIERGMTKSILRKSMKGLLPEKIRARKDKIGFGTPQDEWFRTNKFQKLIFDTLNSSSFRQRGFVDSQKALKMYQDHLKGRINIAKEIWKWIHLELWFKKFIDK